MAIEQGAEPNSRLKIIYSDTALTFLLSHADIIAAWSVSLWFLERLGTVLAGQSQCRAY